MTKHEKGINAICFRRKDLVTNKNFPLLSSFSHDLTKDAKLMPNQLKTVTNCASYFWVSSNFVTISICVWFTKRLVLLYIHNAFH